MKLKERRIGLNDFLVVIRKFYFLIIAGALVLGGAGWLTASRSVEENYTASSMVYVQTVSTDMDIGTSSTETALARALAASCVTVMKNDALVKNVRRYFAERRADSPEENWEDLSVYSDSALLGMISAYNEANRQDILITVTAPTPSLAAHLANAVAGELEVSVVDVIGNCMILPVSAAGTATRNRVDARRSTALTGALLGAVLVYVILVAIRLCDRTLRRGEEAEDYAVWLPLLGTVPNEREGEEA